MLGAAIVLLIAFGSVIAAGLRSRSRSSASGSPPAADRLLANVVDVPDFTPAVSGLIGIGVGVDYALLWLTRFRRDEQGKDHPRRHRRVRPPPPAAAVIIAGSPW